jgi:hypothetical protein
VSLSWCLCLCLRLKQGEFQQGGQASDDLVWWVYVAYVCHGLRVMSFPRSRWGLCSITSFSLVSLVAYRFSYIWLLSV